MTRRDRVGGEVECYFQIMELARNLELGIRAHYNNFSNRHLHQPWKLTRLSSKTPVQQIDETDLRLDPQIQNYDSCEDGNGPSL